MNFYANNIQVCTCTCLDVKHAQKENRTEKESGENESPTEGNQVCKGQSVLGQTPVQCYYGKVIQFGYTIARVKRKKKQSSINT